MPSHRRCGACTSGQQSLVGGLRSERRGDVAMRGGQESVADDDRAHRVVVEAVADVRVSFRRGPVWYQALAVGPPFSSMEAACRTTRTIGR